MKENPYDNETFFEKYRHFPRSEKGLTAAGEWPALQKLLPDFTGKRVLDLGCGFGWHCQYAAQNGAKNILGIDISSKMLEIARQKNAYSNVIYRQTAIEDYEFPENAFDIVISSLAFHYIEDFSGLYQKIYRCLVKGGNFVFSVEHPVFTAEGKQDWWYNAADGTKQHWPVDNYFTEGKRQTVFLGENVIKYHHTLTTYLTNLLQTGFILTDIIEPTPTKEMLQKMPQMAEELRRPMMLLIAAKKAP